MLQLLLLRQTPNAEQMQEPLRLFGLCLHMLEQKIERLLVFVVIFRVKTVQHWAVIVRNMFKEEQIGNLGQY